ncbi:cytochrome P450 [Aspergillus similis]
MNGPPFRGSRQDISAQLVLKWDRFGPEQEIELIDDMSRLTFDTIGLCAFGYRFNEFYTDRPHPFMRQLKESIVESGKRANRPDLINQLYYRRDEQHRQENIVHMRHLCRKIIQERLENPRPDANDLLNVMLHGVDRETGEKLGVENVVFQIPTLLRGGYETTSSTLCFIYYFLCNNPDKLQKAREEVDCIVGENVLSYDMLRKLKYLDAVMKESLRLQHPVSLLIRFATRDTIIGGKYLIKKGQTISGIWRHFHRDPDVWGADADAFRPERMLDVNFSKLPTNSWKPFGDGLRACIGRGFAEQEILINLAMVLQKFDIEKVNPEYKLELTGQMGVKPVGFKIRVRRRPDRHLTAGIPGGVTTQEFTKPPLQQTLGRNGFLIRTRQVSVFYGGFLRIYGLQLDIQELDAATRNLPVDRPCIIITPSYEGRPPDNAKRFVHWIESLLSEGLNLQRGTRFAVFGVGNSDWVHTFHRIPVFLDESLEKLGAERILEAGFANVKRDLIGPWEAWSEKLCMTLSDTIKQKPLSRAGVDVQIERGKVEPMDQIIGGEQMFKAVVTTTFELADTTMGPAKRHVEVRLPARCEYRSGDYLVIQGQNSDETVSRVMARFNLSVKDILTVQSSKKAFLPSRPMAVEDFLRHRVELATPISKRQLEILASFAKDESDERTQLERMHVDVYYQEILDKRYSVIDVLEEFPRLDLPFGVYIDFLLPLSPRLYSISSSPVKTKNDSPGHAIVASITFDVFEAKAMSGHGTFRGVVSSYLASRMPGDSILCCIRPTKVPFHLPLTPETPVIMIAAGTGIAPMRAFCQEREALSRAGQCKLGLALLYFGCRHPAKDYIYRSELEAWEQEGIVEVIPCFSRAEGSNRRHVSDALWDERERAWAMLESGASIYVCGSAGKVGRSVAATWRRIWMEKTGKGETDALEWLDTLKNDRYISDLY